MDVKKVTVRSRFSMMAKRKGGKKREDAIAAGEEAVEAYRPEYLEWVVEDLDAIDDLLKKASLASSFDAETMDQAYRKVAHVRDLGSTFDHTMTTAVADRMCELLYRMAHTKTFHRAAIRSLRDALRLVCSTAFQGKSVEDYHDFLTELDQVVGLFPEVTAPSGDADAEPKPKKTVH